MTFPWTDWQFYCVTLAAAWGFWTVLRQLIPSKDDKACPGCASGAAARAKRTGGGGGLVTLGDRGTR